MNKICLIINMILIASVGALTAGAGEINRTNADLNGDGKTDLVNLRGINDPAALGSGRSLHHFAGSYRERTRKRQVEGLAAARTQLAWAASITGSDQKFETPFGIVETDIILVEDFDGDGTDDLGVWRPGAAGADAAFFYILQSSDSSVRIEPLGQTGDDPTVSGDYDGDGRADPAVFRCPSANQPAGQCFYAYRGSRNNPSGNVTFVPWGFGNIFDFYANPGDFDGDGKHDFCLQRDDGAGQGQFVLLRSSDQQAEFIYWGTPDDLIAPGDYDGDGRDDFMVVRNVNNQRHWYLLERDGGGTGAAPVIFGISVTDFIAPGDYDGDGKTDIAVWRGSFVPGQSSYYILNSGDGMLQTHLWGEAGDYPAANWAVH